MKGETKYVSHLVALFNWRWKIDVVLSGKGNMCIISLLSTSKLYTGQQLVAMTSIYESVCICEAIKRSLSGEWCHV